MRRFIPVLAALATIGGIAGLPADARADSCVGVEGAVIINRCRMCMEVTVRNLQPPGQSSSGAFAGEPITIRVEAGGRATVPGGGRIAVTDLKKCG